MLTRTAAVVDAVGGLVRAAAAVRVASPARVARGAEGAASPDEAATPVAELPHEEAVRPVVTALPVVARPQAVRDVALAGDATHAPGVPLGARLARPVARDDDQRGGWRRPRSCLSLRSSGCVLSYGCLTALCLCS